MNRFAAFYTWLTHIQSTQPDTVRRGRLLNLMIVGVELLMLLFLPQTIVEGTWAAQVVIGISVVVAYGAIQRSRQGDPRRAAYLFLGMLWLGMSAVMLNSSTAPAAFSFMPFLYPVPIIVAGLTAGPRAPFVFAAITEAWFIVIAVRLPNPATYRLSAGGVFQPTPVIPTEFLLTTIGTYLLLFAFLSWLMERTLTAALSETGRQATSLAESEAGMAQRARELQLATTLRGQTANLVTTMQQQNAATAQQAASVQEVTATVEELTRTARDIARAAQQVQATAASVVQRVQVGQDSVAATDSSVTRLGAGVAAISERVGVVNDHVGQISRIADVLTDIAANIHLLAFNTAIEAAGAGAGGRRFSVIAREVQELADQARVAGTEVQAQVTTIQAVTAEALQSARAGRIAAAEAVAQMTQTRTVQAEIHSVAEEAAQLATQIAGGMAQQQLASAQVLESLQTFSEAAHDMARSSDQVAGATTRLGRLAADLDATQHAGEAAIGPAPQPAAI